MAKRLSVKRAVVSALSFLAVSVSCVSYGAGFAIIEQSVSGLGTAYSGGSSQADDPSTVFFNPAGMTRLKGTQGTAGLSAIKTSFKFHNSDSTHILTPLTGEGLTGTNGGDAGTLGLVPNLYVVTNRDNGWYFGLGVGAPFGLVTDYDTDWVGRYHALKSGITSINLNPSVAMKTGNLSIGAGLNAMYMEGEFSQAIDYGTATAALGGIPQREDGKAVITADSWGYGYNIGLLYELSENTRMGLAYRSRVTQNLKGDAEFTALAKTRALLAAVGSKAADNTDVSSDVTLPDTISFGVYHRIDPKLAFTADVLWTNWSTINELRMVFENGTSDSVTTLDWEDTWRISAGMTYAYSDKLDLRCGIAYDEAPVPSASKRTPRLPDNDRIWLSLGGGYRLSDSSTLDVAYAHIFANAAKIDKSPVGEDALKGGLKGSAQVYGDILAVSFTKKW